MNTFRSCVRFLSISVAPSRGLMICIYKRDFDFPCYCRLIIIYWPVEEAAVSHSFSPPITEIKVTRRDWWTSGGRVVSSACLHLVRAVFHRWGNWRTGEFSRNNRSPPSWWILSSFLYKRVCSMGRWGQLKWRGRSNIYIRAFLRVALVWTSLPPRPLCFPVDFPNTSLVVNGW